MEGERPMSTFTVEGLPGLTFTAALDPDRSGWLVIRGHNEVGEFVSGTGIAVPPGVVEDVPITPEVTPAEGGTEAAAAHIESFAPPEPAGDN